MSAKGLIAGLGPVMQMAYVPSDFDAALDHWIRVVGAGPFFMLNHVALEAVHYRGAPVSIDFSLALGYWGDIQIEIIRQNDQTPSIYKEWRDAGREGLHHVCLLAEDMGAARAACDAVGAQVIQDGIVPGGGAVIYVDTGGGPGTMIEILKPAPGGLGFFAMMREAARNWDGSDPVRVLS